MRYVVGPCGPNDISDGEAAVIIQTTRPSRCRNIDNTVDTENDIREITVISINTGGETTMLKPKRKIWNWKQSYVRVYTSK